MKSHGAGARVAYGVLSLPNPHIAGTNILTQITPNMSTLFGSTELIFGCFPLTPTPLHTRCEKRKANFGNLQFFVLSATPGIVGSFWRKLCRRWCKCASRSCFRGYGRV